MPLGNQIVLDFIIRNTKKLEDNIDSDTKSKRVTITNNHKLYDIGETVVKSGNIYENYIKKLYMKLAYVENQKGLCW